jgi:hypothetical protein
MPLSIPDDIDASVAEVTAKLDVTQVSRVWSALDAMREA